MQTPIASLPQPHYVLRVIPPNKTPQTRYICKPQAVVGRVSGEIIVPDPRLSAEHAVIGFEHGRVWLQDLRSTNGTFVDAHRVSSVELHPGSSFVAGETWFELLAVRGAGPGSGAGHSDGHTEIRWAVSAAARATLAAGA